MVIEFKARPNYEMRSRRVELQDLTTSDFRELRVEQDQESSGPRLPFCIDHLFPHFTSVVSSRNRRQKFDEASKAVGQCELV
jgi:hypothetical protein